MWIQENKMNFSITIMCKVFKVNISSYYHWIRSGSIVEKVDEALDMAIKRRKPKNGLIWHTDRGSQYASLAHKELLQAHGIVQSMSRKGNCWDCALNEVRKCPWGAVAESFFKTLKKELVRKQNFETREIEASKIFEYIEMFYNAKRRHSYLDYISPNKFERRYNIGMSKTEVFTELENI